MWLLIFGFHELPWGHGAIRAVLLIGIAALAILCVRAPPMMEGSEPRRWIAGVVIVVLLAHAGYFVARLNCTHDGEPLPDIAGTTLAAMQTAARGENPYTAPIDEVADTALLFYSGHGMEVLEKRDYYNVFAPTDAKIN